MQQGYFEEARDVLRALEAENPTDSELPGLYSRLAELIREAEINPPVQQLERSEENVVDTFEPERNRIAASQPDRMPQAQAETCCSVPMVEHKKYIPTPDASRTQRLVNTAADIGIEVAQRAVTGLVKGLNRVITRIQERKGGL